MLRIYYSLDQKDFPKPCIKGLVSNLAMFRGGASESSGIIYRWEFFFLVYYIYLFVCV